MNEKSQMFANSVQYLLIAICFMFLSVSLSVSLLLPAQMSPFVIAILSIYCAPFGRAFNCSPHLSFNRVPLHVRAPVVLHVRLCVAWSFCIATHLPNL